MNENIESKSLLGTYLEILWRRRRVILATIVIAGAIAAAGGMLITPEYEASTTLRLATSTSGSLDWVNYDITYADRLLNTFSEIATGAAARAELAKRLGLDAPPQVDSAILANTELLRLKVQHEDPAIAARAANVLAQILMEENKRLSTEARQGTQKALAEQIAQLSKEIEKDRQAYQALTAQPNQTAESLAQSIRLARDLELKRGTYETLTEYYRQATLREALGVTALSVIDPATVPTEPSSPGYPITIALGLVLGLIGGLGLAFLFESLDTTLHTTAQIQAISALPILGEIPLIKDAKEQVLFMNTNSYQGEALRRLRTNIAALGGLESLRTLLVTSPEPEEGKSTIVANLALAIGQSGRSVVLVDANLRLPVLHHFFNLPNDTGLSDLLRGHGSLSQVLQSANVPGVQVITSGPLPFYPADLLGSSAMISLLQQLRQQFDMVLLDSPAMLPVADAPVLAPMVDGVILVLEQGKTRAEATRKARAQLLDVDARLVGAVVNRAPWDSEYEEYYKQLEMMMMMNQSVVKRHRLPLSQPQETERERLPLP